MQKLSLLFVVLLTVLLSNPGSAEQTNGIELSHQNCDSCHESHNAAPGQVLISVDFVDDLCFQCHQNPQQAAQLAPRVQPWDGRGSNHLAFGFDKFKRGYTRPVKVNEKNLVLQQTCIGCHDPHSRAPRKPREIAFDTQGIPISETPQFFAEVCYGCHAGPEAVMLPKITTEAGDIGALFGSRIVSSHRIGESGKDRPDLPSLIGAAVQGPLDCTSCHNNPDPTGARGPHSSIYPALLKSSYGSEMSGNLFGERSDELCYGCHRRESILNNQSFPWHREHLRGLFVATLQKKNIGSENRRQQGLKFLGLPNSPDQITAATSGFGQPTACATCHDPHGSLEHSALIRFDPQVVMPSSVGGPYFRRTSLRHGTCTLFCHGYDHVQTRY